MNNIIKQFAGGFKGSIDEMMSIDPSLGNVCSIANSKFGLRTQSNETSLSKNIQHIDNGTYSTSIDNKLLNGITDFFNKFNEKMKEARKKLKERIKGKVNLESNTIKTVSDEENKTIKTSADKGYTIIGVKLLPNDKTLKNVDVDKNRKDPVSLDLESQELARLKALRENIKNMKLEEEQGLKLEESSSLKMKPTKFVPNGFTGAASLLVFMSVIATIIELFIIYAGTLD